MRIYFAGLKLENSTKLMIKEGVHKLCSFAYPEQLRKYVSYFKEVNPIKLGTLIIDSGAFTAWSKGKQVNLDQYIEYCKRVQGAGYKYFTEIYPVNLDVIPGQKGRENTRDEVAQSAEKGWENYEYMKLKGLEPIHVFHSGENFKWLKQCIDNNMYIGVSPCNDYSHVQKREWLKECFQMVCENNGKPKIRTHAFGVTSFELLELFPWFSADSAAWSLQSGFGGVSTPWGKFDMSTRRSESENTLSRHPTHVQKTVKEWILSKGIDFDRLRNDYKLRDEVNIHYFLYLQDKLINTDRTYCEKQMQLF